MDERIKGVHDIKDESWNGYGQFTYIYGWKQAFHADYTNLNGSNGSLLPTAEQSFTGSATAFLGAQPWKGGEAYFVPEMIAERPLSQLKGLGGAVQDFELQKGGAETPTLYVSRVFLKQTIELGGTPVHEESGPMQLAKTYMSRRLVFAACVEPTSHAACSAESPAASRARSITWRVCAPGSRARSRGLSCATGYLAVTPRSPWDPLSRPHMSRVSGAMASDARRRGAANSSAYSQAAQQRR